MKPRSANASGVLATSHSPRGTRIEVIQDLSAISSAVTGFLRRYRLRAKTELSNGLRTETYFVDYVDRAPGRSDAVAVGVVAPMRGRPPEEARILLRQQVRYPVFVATREVLCTEVVAGIIEGEESAAHAALREVEEETGLTVDPSAVSPLGQPVFASPGTLTERFFPAMVVLPEGALDDLDHLAPRGDGSPMEEGAVLLTTTLDDALRAIDAQSAGLVISDAKTEIVLHRMKRALETRR